MEIRPAVPEDARAIAEVHVRTWQAAYINIVPQPYLDGMSIDEREKAFREALTRGKTEMWVAVEREQVIGWIGFGPSRDAGAPPDVGEIEAVYVLPEHWSTAAGRELWRTGVRRLAERGFTSVTLWVLEDNARAIRFYRSVGMQPNPASRKMHPIAGTHLAKVRYESQPAAPSTIEG
jgi:ribosomal protein S18 acetylase RimI-like enzyme